MKKLNHAGILLGIVIISLLPVSCSGRFAEARAAHRAEREIAGGSRKHKESWRIRLAKKQQEKRQGKIKKNYARSIENSRKRTFEIQSPEVKERMKQNNEAIKTRDKMNHKKVRSSSKKAGNKYK
jgi:hypothetical protein